MAPVSQVHPCIARAIVLAVNAERVRQVAKHWPGEPSRLAFEVRALALSRGVRLALDELTRK